MARDIERFAFVICTLRVRDMSLTRRKAMEFHAHKVRISREQREAISRLQSKHITRDEVALYHDGVAVYIIPL